MQARRDLLAFVVAIAPAQRQLCCDFGFGLLIDEKDGHSRVWHGGGINGFSSTLETYPDLDLTIVVLANTAGGADAAAAGIGTAVLRQFEKPKAPRRPE